MTSETNDSFVVSSVNDFYEHEESLARTLSSDEILSTASSLLSDFSGVLSRHVDTDQELTTNELHHVLALLVKLRCLNRRSNLRTKLQTDVVDAKKRDAEKKQMTLQNLEMEIEHIEESIENIKAVQTTQLDLVNVEEYCTAKGITIPEAMAMPEHDRLVAMMSYELELRKEFLSKIEAAKSELVDQQVVIDEKDKKLDALLPHIIQVQKVVQPILRQLDLQITTPHLERAARAKHLPPQLSALYVNVVVYNKINDGAPLKYMCSGSIEEAISFERALGEEKRRRATLATSSAAPVVEVPIPAEIDDPQSDDEDMDGDGDAMEVDRADAKPSRQREEEMLALTKLKQKIFVAYPISFTTEVPGHTKTNLAFYYLPELEIVTVKANIDENASYSPLLQASTILDNVYDGDTGTLAPTSPAEALLSLAGVTLADVIAVHGKPYAFAQELCLPASDSASSSHHDRFKYFLRTVLRVGDRIRARRSVDAALSAVNNGGVLKLLPERLQSLIPTREGGFVIRKISSVKAEDVLSVSELNARQQAILKRLNETGQLAEGFQFICNVERSDGTTIAGAIFHVPCGYADSQSASIVLIIPSDKNSFEALTNFEALETYLNVDVPRLVGDELHLAFALQLAMLPSRCEVAKEIAEADTTVGGKTTYFFVDKHVSRINEPQFNYLPAINAFGKGRS